MTLSKHEGFTVHRRTAHRTRASARAVILMVETASIVLTGDT